MDLDIFKPRGEVATKKTKSITEILKDDSLRIKLNNLIDEAVKCKQKIALEQETIKQLREVAKEDVGIDSKLFNSYLSMILNNDYMVKKDNAEQQLDLIDYILKMQGSTSIGNSDGDDE